MKIFERFGFDTKFPFFMVAPNWDLCYYKKKQFFALSKKHEVEDFYQTDSLKHIYKFLRLLC